MSDEQFNKIMHAISLDLAVRLKPLALTAIDTSQLRGAAIDADYILFRYEDWAEQIKSYLTKHF